MTDKGRDESGERIRKRLEAVLETTVDGIITMGSDRSIQTFNTAAERIFGYKAEEVLGKNVNILMPEPYRSAHDKYVERYLDSREAHIIGIGREVIGLRKDGSTFPLDLAVSEAKVGEEVLFTGIVRDLSEQRKIEQQLRQLQKMDALGVLAGGIAHNFNNVLSGVLGFIELALTDSAEGSPQYHFLEEAQAAALRGKELTSQILSLGRKQEANFTFVNVGDVVKETLKFIQGAMPSTITASSYIEKDLGPIVGDASLLHQILVNLYTNAYQAMDPYEGGSIDVRVESLPLGTRILRRVFNSPVIRITVKDSGHGMDQLTLSRIFEPFFTTKRQNKGPGTGLGLATVHSGVIAMSGEIVVESEPGKGTTFQIYLPMTAPKEIRNGPAAQAPKQRPREILFVDDEESLVRLGEAILGRHGYVVTGMHNPVEALQLFHEDPARFSLVISDYTMPGITGLQLLDRIHQARPDLPLMLASGYSARLTPESAKELGISQYLTKPYKLEELVEAVDKVIGPKPKENAAPRPASSACPLRK